MTANNAVTTPMPRLSVSTMIAATGPPRRRLRTAYRMSCTRTSTSDEDTPVGRRAALSRSGITEAVAQTRHDIFTEEALAWTYYKVGGSIRRRRHLAGEPL